MTKRFLSFLIVCMTAVSTAFAQSLLPTMLSASEASSTTAEKNAGLTKGKINLSQSNPFSVAPWELFSWATANGFHAQKKNQCGPRRIAASENFPNDPYVYGAISSTYQTVNEGYEQGQVVGFYLNSKSSLYTEMNGATLPAASYGSRNMYVRVEDKWYTFDSNKVTVTDAKTGETLQEAETDVDNACRGASYDYNRKKFYVINFSGLFEIDAETFESENLGTLGGGFVCCVAAAPDGNIYYVTYAGQLYKYDYETKECTQVLGNVKIKNDAGNLMAWQNQGFCAAFDWTTNDLYYTFIDNAWTCRVVRLDITGEQEPENVYNMPGKEMTLMGLYFANPAKGAPAPAENISFSDDRVLTFTVPTQTVDGEALTDGLKAIITVNGKESSYDVTAGETKHIATDLNGSVNITIVIANSAGRSAERKVITFIGTDLPTHVTNLVLAADEGSFTLTWDAPTTSQNGGPVDESSLNYTVTRMPDEVVVAEGLKATSFTEPVPVSCTDIPLTSLPSI